MTDQLDTAAIRAKAKMWHLPAGIADDILALCDALDNLRAENERLVEAARAFASWDHCGPGNINLDAACRDIRVALTTMETDHD